MLASEGLYMKDNFLRKDIDILINKPIIEYDLKSANTSLCKYYNLLDKKTIKKIEMMPKHDRVVTIGKLQRADKVFKENLKQAFKDIRLKFFKENNIDENDVLAIKKDAIFMLKPCNYTQFGECNFIPKNEYTSYIYLNRQLEVYFNRMGICDAPPKVDVKGISDISLKKHEGYLLEFLARLFTHLEDGNRTALFKFINNFVSKYKHRHLPVGYYREFNNLSIFRVNEWDATFSDDTFLPFEYPQEHLDIDYNFANVIIPIINLLIR
jgi:hypothetical protein